MLGYYLSWNIIFIYRFVVDVYLCKKCLPNVVDVQQ